MEGIFLISIFFTHGNCRIKHILVTCRLGRSDIRQVKPNIYNWHHNPRLRNHLFLKFMPQMSFLRRHLINYGVVKKLNLIKILNEWLLGADFVQTVSFRTSKILLALLCRLLISFLSHIHKFGLKIILKVST